MKIGHSYELAYIGRDNWEQLAEEVQLVPELVVARVRALAEATPAAFARAVDDDSIRALVSDLPAALLRHVTRRAARCSARL